METGYSCHLDCKGQRFMWLTWQRKGQAQVEKLLWIPCFSKTQQGASLLMGITMVSSNCTRNPASIVTRGGGGVQDVDKLYEGMLIATASFSFLFHLFKAGGCGHVGLFEKMSPDSLFQTQFPYPDEFVLGPHLPFFQGGIYSLPKRLLVSTAEGPRKLTINHHPQRS